MGQTEVATNMHNVLFTKEHDSDFERLQRRNTHSSHKYNGCIPDIYSNLLKAKQNILF